MSAENIEAIGNLYRAMNDRDPEAIADLVHPTAEWVPDARVGEVPVRGLDNIVRFFSDRAEMFESVATVTERLMDADDKVLAFVRITGVGRASGAEFDIRIAHLWTLRDGLIVRGEGYGDRDRALEAAGLGEHPG